MAIPTISGLQGGLRRDAGALSVFGALFCLAGLAQLAGPVAGMAVGIVFFVAGLGHGAGDENGGGMRAYTWPLVAAYLVTGLAVSALFLAAPLAGLALFLVLSAWHFARSDSGYGWHANLAIALLAVGGSALLQPEATDQIFAQVLGQQAPRAFILPLQIAGAGGLLAAGWAVFRGIEGSLAAALAALACLIFNPVLAVGLIFLGMHAIPIQRRQIACYGQARVARAVAAPTLVATFGAAGVAFAVWQGWLALDPALALAFGMATPHMLTERLER